MHSVQLRQQAIDLRAAGLCDREIGERLGVPRETARDWRNGRVKNGWPGAGPCPRCWLAAREMRFTDGDYAELLGLYLGDGHIAAMARTQMLRLSMDLAHPRVLADTKDLLERCFVANKLQQVSPNRGALVVLAIYCCHLTCLFPQSGPGKKHDRRIKLEAWQQARVDAEPWRFLRGLIRSDGCVFINRTGPYEYLSYDFANRSADILDLFTETCDRVGVACCRNPPRVRINRRASVALMREYVGVKG